MVVEATQQDASPEGVQVLESRPAHEQIASLAYALWQQRGSPDGSSEEDWFKAEQELLAQLEA
jgi:hypothetical protein